MQVTLRNMIPLRPTITMPGRTTLTMTGKSISSFRSRSGPVPRAHRKRFSRCFKTAVAIVSPTLPIALTLSTIRTAMRQTIRPKCATLTAQGINSWLSGAAGIYKGHPAANYVIMNDGSGAFHVALHETLNNYGHQIAAWLAANPTLSASHYYVNPDLAPAIRAYRTSDGRLNFVAVASVTKNVNQSLPLWVSQYILVNIPLRLDITSQFTQPLTIRDRNGSHLIRTFAGDDVIYSGNNGGFSKVDGGAGTRHGNLRRTVSKLLCRSQLRRHVDN